MPVPRRRPPRPGHRPAARRIPPPRHAPSPRLPRKAAVYRPRPAARQQPAPRRRARHAAFVGPTQPSPARAPLAARRLAERPRLPRRKRPTFRPAQRPPRAAPAKARPRPARRGTPSPFRRARPAPAQPPPRAAAFRCAPKGGSNSWAVPAGDRGPLSREFSQNSGVGVLAPKQKKTAPKDDLWWCCQWLFEPVIAGAFAAAFSCQFAGCDQLAKRALDGADAQ